MIVKTETAGTIQIINYKKDTKVKDVVNELRALADRIDNTNNREVRFITATI